MSVTMRMMTMNDMSFYMPVKLFTGADILKKHGDALSALGDSCLIVTGKSAAKKSGALDDAVNTLRALNIRFEVFDGVEPNPGVESCAAAGDTAAKTGAEFILGIGGGSALDSAKAAAVFAANPGLNEADFYAKKWNVKPLPIALIGTTSGTGSEVTNVSVLTDSKHKKHSIHDDLLYAAVSFGDPKYTVSLPQNVTLSTGIDILAHCAESYFSKKANEISRSFACSGIRLMLAPLTAAADGAELTPEQRDSLYKASILGGLAISVTGTCFPHNVGYYFTENFGLPHGLASAVLLPELLGHAESVCQAEYESFLRSIGCGKTELPVLTGKAVKLPEIRLTEEQITAALPRWADNGSVKNTVGNVTAEDIGRMLRKLFCC